ncbi:hypothetical protein DESUT3_37560 [Desulfuromonas versatilis]|uniref:Peptidase S8/S53 domain-containing protein n=1 Tax=Desulfuromonas versatilis TaxID=2802975 RepID=A0ABN6E2X9_9BACT|nr:S8 family serine peptidase [Desulfuromonas versatilis]BCR06687.1 hypothetical protein DESUT3_37560 [Desulfuromonas versatilis]
MHHTANGFRLSFIAIFLVLLFSTPLLAGVTSSDLQNAMEFASPGEQIPVIVTLSDKADLRAFKTLGKKDRRSGVVTVLKDKAKNSQKALRAYLKGLRKQGIKDLWAINGLALRATPEEIAALAAWPGVASVTLDAQIPAPTLAPQALGGVEDNLAAINAPALWDLGIAGQGMVVGIMDTGVDVRHPYLAAKWRGGTNSWYDPHGQHPNSPADVAGHGTAVTGVVVGGQHNGVAFGVAPEAQWIAVKAFNDAGNAPLSAIHLGFQWFLDPDGNPATDDAPDVVNNSWGFEMEAGSCIDQAHPDPDLNADFHPDIQALQAAGIAVVFAAGNTGPNPATSVSPANYPEAFGVGMVDTFFASPIDIVSQSARGPSACDGTIFPEIVAPGEQILTTGLPLVIDGVAQADMVRASGTSFASPHMAGVMALLLQAFPDFPVADLQGVLQQTALDGLNPQDPAGPDNTYGYGLVDALAAHQALVVATTPNLVVSDSLAPADDRQLPFGHVPDGDSRVETVTLANTDGVPLEVGPIAQADPLAPPFSLEAGTDTCSNQTIPAGGDCTFQVRIAAVGGGIFSDTFDIPSNDPDEPVVAFAVSASRLKVLAPNGGEILAVGSSYAVEWSAVEEAMSYDLSYSIDDGSSWTLIVTGLTANNHLWTVPAADSANCLVRVTAYGAGGAWLANDESDGSFTILPGTPPSVLAVVSPNGSESLTGGTTHTLQWAAHAGAANYLVRYSTNGGANWNAIASITGTSFAWMVPAADSANCLVRVTAYDAGGAWLANDVSDGAFTLLPGTSPSVLAVVSPNGGEALTGGTTHTIQWAAHAGAANYLVRYSTNGGANWNAIASITGTSFAWMVPAADSANCLVRVTAYDAGGAWLANDVSDGAFTLLPGTSPSVLAVVSPNGGEALTGGTTHTIQWAAHAGAANYLVRYSTNGGASWNPIASVVGTSFEWTVPATDSNNCLVRVTGYNAGGAWLANDVSDGPFTILPGTPPSALAVGSPNGGETLTGGATYTIQWAAHAGAANYLVRYSTNGGVSWSPIASVPGTSFAWTLPAADSANCLVRVTAYDAGGAWLANDVSNDPFTISP